MRFLALELILSLLDVRGHIPRFDDFRPAPAAPAPGGAVRAVAAAIAVFIVLALAVWTTVWLAVNIF
ncbi:hypothetical protein [Bradyrhizobium cajani]|uniref:Uncharacterized protein n=1 Tax=Bradyrhizobium cajani TaxID=1928661 RepID=A0A844TI79_9BRAD|nr:hypothetical protein [Bradyrhizobium cajani]MCP3374292.1 hypothetical protein [Bradyrhizobium cajani]MVT77245.1 hypothetical protein [Bradyrhizobium cajani]